MDRIFKGRDQPTAIRAKKKDNKKTKLLTCLSWSIKVMFPSAYKSQSRRI